MAIVGSAYIEIKAITDKLEAEVKTAVSKIKDTVNVNVNADTAAAAAQIKAVSDIVGDSVSVEVNADTLPAKKSIQDLIQSVSDAVHLDVDADTSGAEDHVAGATARMSRKTVVLSALANTFLAARQIAFTARDRIVTLYLNLNNASVAKVTSAISRLSGFRVLSDYVRDFTDKLSNLDKAVPGIAKMSLLFANLGSVILSSGAGLLTMGSSLMSIIDMAGLALPGILAGFATGFITLIVALKDFSKQLPEVVAQYKTLSGVIRENFWAEARDSIRDMAQTLFPQFRDGLASTSQALGVWTAGLSDSLKIGLGNGVLVSMFDRLKESIQIAAGATDDNVRSMIAIGQVGGNLLPRLASWWVDVSNKFNDFIMGAQADGSLNRWVEEGISALKTLGGGLRDLGGIFGNLSDAAKLAGSNGLLTFANTMSKIREATSSQTFLTGMSEIFRGAGAGAALLGDALGKVIGALGKAGPTISNILVSAGASVNVLAGAVAGIISNPAFQAGVQSMFKGIQAGITALAPSLELLGPKLGAIGTLVGMLAENLGGVLGKALEIAIPPLLALAQNLEPLIPILGNGLISILEAISPLIAALGPLFAQIGPPLAELVTKIISLLVPAIKILADIITWLVPIIANSLTFILQSASNVVDLLSAIFSGDLAGIFNAFMSQITLVLNFLADQFDQIFGTDIRQALEDFGNGWNGFWADFSAAWNAFWGGFAGFFMDIWNGIVTFVSTVWNNIIAYFNFAGSVISTAWNNLWTGISAAFNIIFGPTIAAIQIVFDVLNAIISGSVALIVEIWTQAWNIVLLIFQGVWMQLVAFFSPIINEILITITTVVNIISAYWTAAWSTIGAVFAAIWNSIVAIFSPIINTIFTTITTVVSVITAYWSAAWSTIGAIFSVIWNTIIGVVSGAVNTVYSIISSVVSTVYAYWSSAWSSIGAAFNVVWNMIVQGASMLAVGIMTYIGNAVNTVLSFPGKVIGAVSNFGSILTGAGRSLIQGLINGINDMFGAAMAKVREVGSGVANAVKSFFGIKSPSRMFRFEIGRQLGAGLVLGLEDSIAPVMKATDKLIGAATPNFSNLTSMSFGSNGVFSSPSRINADLASMSSAPQVLGGGPTINVYPAAGLSEKQIGIEAASELAWQLLS